MGKQSVVNPTIACILSYQVHQKFSTPAKIRMADRTNAFLESLYSTIELTCHRLLFKFFNILYLLIIFVIIALIFKPFVRMCACQYVTAVLQPIQFYVPQGFYIYILFKFFCSSIIKIMNNISNSNTQSSKSL